MSADEIIARVSRRIAQTVQFQHDPPPEVPAVQPPGLDTPLASYIDHTLLKADATPDQIAQLCQEAEQYGFASVCVNPVYVEQCASRLPATRVAVCTVVGFPLGATTTEVKVFEARQAIHHGAREIDMVISVGQLKAENYTAVFNDISRVVTVCRGNGALCKVIIEAALLTDEEKIAACLLAVQARAPLVKTSTGFASSGATFEDVTLMRRVVGPSVGIKAAGGIRTRRDAQKMFAAGATRIGSSSSVQIVSGK